MRVAYLTDVEGSWDKLFSFVVAADGVSFDSSGDSFDGDGRIVVDDGFIFVFGGDAVDRGPWSRKVCRVLLEAKLRQPDRVVLLGGNRDINKLRLPRELEGAVPKKAPPEVMALLAHEKPALLRWILSNTMGAQPAFDHRQTELLATGQAASDDDVVRSFLTDLLPGGLHFRYLQQTQLAFRLGKTLYVHGGIDDECLGKVPGEPDSDDVDGWIFSLNQFYRAQLGLYAEQPVVVGKEPLWLPVILYQAPSRAGRNPASVVYGRFGNDPWNNPRLPPRTALSWLWQRGIARVVVGHTPCGDLPTILRPPAEWHTPVEIVIADNSRARLDHGNVVTVDDDAITVTAKTVLDAPESTDPVADPAAAPSAPVGPVVDVRYVLPAQSLDDAPGVGSMTAAGSLVKAVVDEGCFLFRFGPNWVLQQTRVDRAALPPLVPAVDALPV